MKWFYPSWNGDFRIEPDGDGTVLIMVQPTTYELTLLDRAAVLFREKGWWKGEKLWNKDKKWFGKARTQRVNLTASMTEVGPELTSLLKGGEQTVTAIAFADGRVETVTGTDTKSSKALKEKLGPYRQDAAKPEKKPEPEKAIEKKKDEPKAAATVKRGTMCCPECMPGAIEPATEVLLTFLDEQQHADWARERNLIAYGGTSGHAYLIAHRHTAIARQQTKICFDLDDEIVLHFHDHTVPPEEEVLAAKLILEHHEEWLRNEAACAGIPSVTGGKAVRLFPAHDINQIWNAEAFKNPFGDSGDGIADSMFTDRIGQVLRSIG